MVELRFKVYVSLRRFANILSALDNMGFKLERVKELEKKKMVLGREKETIEIELADPPALVITVLGDNIDEMTSIYKKLSTIR